MALIDDLGEGPVGIDTAIFIYFIEEDTRYISTIAPLFEAADAGSIEIVTSSLTLLEVLVVPYRAGNLALAERYEAALTRGRGIRMIDLDRDHLRRAAQLMASTGVTTPDALQLAAAFTASCTSFVTNDRRLPSGPDLKILQLSSYSR
jgi:predicted nucleic acid-binding protein